MLHTCACGSTLITLGAFLISQSFQTLHPDTHHPLAALLPLHQSPPRRRRSSVVERQLPKLPINLHNRNSLTNAFSATRKLPMSSSAQCMESWSVQMTR